jgi:hypothetical protein
VEGAGAVGDAEAEGDGEVGTTAGEFDEAGTGVDGAADVAAAVVGGGGVELADDPPLVHPAISAVPAAAANQKYTAPLRVSFVRRVRPADLID